MIVLLAAAAGTWWMYSSLARPQFRSSPLASPFAPIVNRTGDASLDALGPMANASISRLLAGEGIDVAYPDEASVSRASNPRGARDAKAELALARVSAQASSSRAMSRSPANELTFQGGWRTCRTSRARGLSTSSCCRAAQPAR